MEAVAEPGTAVIGGLVAGDLIQLGKAFLRVDGGQVEEGVLVADALDDFSGVDVLGAIGERRRAFRAVPWRTKQRIGIAILTALALLTLVLVLAVLVSLVLVKFKQSLLVGYLLSGVMIGNFGLLWLTGLDKGDPVITNFAEIGVVLLMFTLGIEFSLSEFKHLWRTALIGGGLQVGITAGVVEIGRAHV